MQINIQEKKTKQHTQSSNLIDIGKIISNVNRGFLFIIQNIQLVAKQLSIFPLWFSPLDHHGGTTATQYVHNTRWRRHCTNIKHGVLNSLTQLWNKTV